MMEQAKSAQDRLVDLCDSLGSSPERWRVWDEFLAEIRKENPDILNIADHELKLRVHADHLAPKIKAYLERKSATERIENGNAEYEEIMGLTMEQ